MPLWTRQDRGERLRGGLLTPSPASGAGRRTTQVSILCVSVETTKATKRRSNSVFFVVVSFSWERQVEAALWFYVFTTGAINRRARVAFWLRHLPSPAPRNPGRGPNSHMGSRGAWLPTYIFHNTRAERRNGACERAFCCYFCFGFEFETCPTHTVNSGSGATSQTPRRDARYLEQEGRKSIALRRVCSPCDQKYTVVVRSRTIREPPTDCPFVCQFVCPNTCLYFLPPLPPPLGKENSSRF